MSLHWPFIAGAVLVVGIFAAAATTMRAMTRIWMRQWVEAQLGPGVPSGSRASQILAEAHRLLAVSTAAISFVVALAGVLLGANSDAGMVGLVLRVAAIAAAFLLLGMALPRGLARHWAPELATPLVPVLRFAAVLLAPVMWLAGTARRRRREDDDAAEGTEEIGELLREGELEGMGGTKELEFITEVVEFGERQVSEVMTPRTAMTAVDRALEPRDMARRVAESGFSRVPVYQGTHDDVIGLVHVFDILATAGERWPELRPVLHVPAGKRCSELLFEMLGKQQQLAIVLDEHGGTIGLVTLEDLLEELVGEIRDEHDAAPLVLAPDAPAVIVDGSMPVGDVAARFEAPVAPAAADGVQSIGGVIARRLGRIPLVGERIRMGGLEFTVVEGGPARVARLLVQRAGSAAAIELDPPR